MQWEKRHGSFKNVITILGGGGNNTAENYRNVIADLVQSYKANGCYMSLKVHI